MLLLAKVCVHENCQTRTLPAVVGQVSLRLTWLLDLVVKKKKKFQQYVDSNSKLTLFNLLNTDFAIE